uniref:Uncharacterized protein n=1 Tax=Oryza rufipogon TaxID=4529 RepID=A0A0E0N3I7_ORYRU
MNFTASNENFEPKIARLLRDFVILFIRIKSEVRTEPSQTYKDTESAKRHELTIELDQAKLAVRSEGEI